MWTRISATRGVVGGGADRTMSIVEVGDDCLLYLRDWEGGTSGPYPSLEELIEAHPAALTFDDAEFVEFRGAELEEVEGWLHVPLTTSLWLDGEPAYLDDAGTLVSADDRYANCEIIDVIQWGDIDDPCRYTLERLGAHYFVGDRDGAMEEIGSFASEEQARDHFHGSYTPCNVDLHVLDANGELVAVDDDDDEDEPETWSWGNVDVSPDAHRWRPTDPDASDLDAVR